VRHKGACGYCWLYAWVEWDEFFDGWLCDLCYDDLCYDEVG
jgi:hypothetical protein